MRPDLADVLRCVDPFARVAARPEALSFDEVLDAWASALAQRGQPGSPSTLLLYVHFAYCESSCRFCQYFHKVPSEDSDLEGYADYLAWQLDRYRERLGRVAVSHGYLGGGTPTALPAPALTRVLEALSAAFVVRGQLTCESHPINLDEDKLELLRRAGVDRVSMGLQSFDPAVLKRIGRINPPAERVEALVRGATTRGMLINCDLVLGLPGQSLESARHDLERLLAARPDMVHVYRYQPVERLPVTPDPTLRLDRLLDDRLRRIARRAGYIAFVPAAQAAAMVLVRPTRRTIAWQLGVLRRSLRRALDPSAELAQYLLVEAPEANVLGIGPGAISHLYGHALYREATSLTHLATRRPVLVGSRVSAEDELRVALASALASLPVVSLPRLSQRSGLDVETHLRSWLDEARLKGAIVGAKGFLRLTDGDASRRALDRLLPEPSSGNAALVTLRRRPDVEPQLCGNEQRSEAEGQVDAIFGRWCELVGLSRPGQLIAGHPVERLGLGRLHVRVAPRPAPLLEIWVDTAERPSFSRSEHFGFAYRGQERPPSPEETAYLRALAELTRDREAG